MGIPEIVSFDSPRPVGRIAESTVNVYGAVPPLALTVLRYAMPFCPFGNEAGKSVIVGQFIVTLLYACEPVHEFESLAVTVKLYVPAESGKPDQVPLLPSVRPLGAVPDVTAYVTVPIPPPELIGLLYAEPTVPAGSEPGVTVTVGQLMSSV